MSGAWFETIESRDVYEGFARVRVDRVRTPDGEEVEREVVVRHDAVAVVPVTPDGRVLLLHQYRQPVGRPLIELPAGLLDVAGEDPADAAQRELIEELGMRAGTLTPLTTFWNSAGWSTERTTVYLGRELQPAPPPDGFTPKAEEAHLEVVSLAVEDALTAVHDGEITDAKTVIGLLLAARRLGG
ncbi:MAG: NUDIX domain-containing protein [Nitriliruptoraceae bacterium]